MDRAARFWCSMLLGCLGLTLAGGAAAQPTAVGLDSQQAIERYVRDAVGFIDANPHDPRSATVGLELLAVSEWISRPDIADLARTHLFFRQNGTPQAQLAAAAMGSPGNYTGFVIARFQLLQERIPAEQLALVILGTVQPGVGAFGGEVLEDGEYLVTLTTLAGWILDNWPPDVPRESRDSAVHLHAQLQERMEHLLKRDASDREAWVTGARALLDREMNPGDRVVAIGGLMRSGERQPPGLFLDVAILMLPAEERMNEAVLRARAARAVDAGRWREAALLCRELLADAEDDSGAAVRLWRAAALAAEAISAGQREAPEEALVLLQQASEAPGADLLLAALQDLDGVMTAHTRALLRARETLQGVEWIEVEGSIHNRDGGALHFWARDVAGPNGRQLEIMLAPDGRLASALLIHQETVEAWQEPQERIVRAPAEGLMPMIRLSPGGTEGVDRHIRFSYTFGRGGRGLLGVVEEWAREPQFATEDRISRFLAGWVERGGFPLPPEAHQQGTRLAWLQVRGFDRARGDGVVWVHLDESGRLTGMRFRRVEIVRLRYGSGPHTPSRPEWAQWPELPVENRGQLSQMEVFRLTGPLWESLFGSESTAAPPIEPDPSGAPEEP